jgi:hypothetical protein
VPHLLRGFSFFPGHQDLDLPFAHAGVVEAGNGLHRFGLHGEFD